jgi:hypothetical protein
VDKNVHTGGEGVDKNVHIEEGGRSFSYGLEAPKRRTPQVHNYHIYPSSTPKAMCFLFLGWHSTDWCESQSKETVQKKGKVPHPYY